ncbi:dixin-like [Babylonia areolata]|uniref:dixin-like n=1 Tax=Babylonia areolata TaxID=304850 RepID=UPI003FCF878F
MASMASSMSSTSPTSPMGSDESRTWIEPQQQLGAYMAWVNSQLKKKAGAHLIEDLRHDMRDGVVFADIIEIVSKQQIIGIHSVPATYEEMRHNVDLVLQFMTQNRIKMHRISSRDIVEGNLKAVMRLILALAAHYKPMSVRHSASSSTLSSRNSSKNQSMMDIAQGASAALTEARRNAKKAGKRYPRSRHDSRYQESSSEPCSDSDQSYLRPDWRLQQPALHERRELEGCSAGSSPVFSCLPSPRTSLQFTDDSTCFDGTREGDCASVDSEVPCGVDDAQVEAVKDVKRQLLQLQDLILTNSPDSAVEMSFESTTPESLVLLKSQLQHSTLVGEQQREELSRLRNECLQLQGTKAGLQQRLSEQDDMLSQLKSEKLNLEIELQTVTAENVSLHKELKDQVESIKNELGQAVESRDHTISSLRRELMKRDQTIDKLQQETKQQKQLSQDGRQHPPSRRQGSSSSQYGQKSGGKGGKQDRGRAPDKGHHSQSSQHNITQTAVTKQQVAAAEVSFLQDSLTDMQTLLTATATGAGGTDGGGVVQPPPLDRLERSIISVLQNLRAARHLDSSSQSSFCTEPVHLKKFVEMKSALPKLRPGAVIGSKSGGRLGGQRGDGPSTSVIFFADHSIQPVSCLMPGKLGDIRLKDFKHLFENSDKYRFYFKALDPEYGTVKEELTKEDSVVPGWENKIVAWLETESGTLC